MTTLTVAIDKSISIDDRTFAVAGEMGVALTVNVDASLQSLGNGKLTYLDFLRPDGTAYYKGDYDCSSGTFGVTLGATDTVLAYAGDLWIQLVIRDAIPPTGVVVWKSNMLKVVVGNSVGATVPATIAVVPPLTMPATYPAETVTIADTGDLITATNVEDALQEIVGAGRTTQTIKANADAIALKMNLAGGSSNPFTAMPYVGTAPIVESGSNANGRYVRFSDGTLMCMGSITITSGGTTTVTFPATFLPALSVYVSITNYFSYEAALFWSFAGDMDTDMIAYVRLHDGTIPSVQCNAGYIAIGRWKA